MAFQSPAAENPPGDIFAAEDLGGMWRRKIRGEFPLMTISRLPRAWPKKLSLEVTRGFDISPRLVGPGSWYLHVSPSFW